MGIYEERVIKNLIHKERTTVRLSYEGCDFVKLPSMQEKTNLLQNPLFNFLPTSNQVIVQCEIAGDPKLFYINRSERTIREIKSKNITELDAYNNVEELKVESIPLDNIKKLAKKIHFQPLYVRAKKIKDIQLLLTKEQRRQALMVLDDESINFKNTSYTYAFQGFLAKYMGHSQLEKSSLELKKADIEKQKQPRTIWSRIKSKIFTNPQDEIDKIDEMQDWAREIHKLSAEFKRLEEYINNFYGDHNQQILDFKESFDTYTQNIQDKIQQIIDSFPENSPKAKILKKLQVDLTKNADIFEKNINGILLDPKKSDMECLFSIADRSLRIKSLGSFMREQMSLILDAGIDVTYKISNQRLKDVIQVPRLVASLSDAQHLMLIKGQSVVEGPKDNDTYSAISQSMLESITSDEVIVEDNNDWFSIKPYIHKWHPAVVDKVLCLLTGNNYYENTLYGNWRYNFGVQPLKLFASIIEIAFSIPRIIIVLSLGIIETGFSIFPFSKKLNEEKITYKLNQFVCNFYEDFAYIVAPLTHIKNSSWNKYARNQPDDETNNHQEILESCTDYSGYCYSLFIYFTPQLISESVYDFFKSILTTVVKFSEDISYLSSSSKDAEQVYNDVKMRHEYMETFTDSFKKKFNLEEANKLSAGYEKIKYCYSNDISSPLDVFYEIMVVLSNDVVNPMFRKSPGIATFYFAASLLTFGTFVLPASTFAWMKPIPAWLQYLANQISINFTGKSTSLGVTEQLIACFLGWKIGFFSTEFIVEMMHGHFEILEKLFEEPEQIVLGLIVLVGLGMALQYIPELPSTIKIPGLPPIPNFYIVILNLFSEESREVWHGTAGLTSIEYAFLGLKFAMLFHSMLFGSEKSAENLTDVEKIAVAVGNKKFFKKLIDECKSHGVIESVKGNKALDANLKSRINDIVTNELSAKHLSFSVESIDVFNGLLLEQIKRRENSSQTKRVDTSIEHAHKELSDAIKMTADDKRLCFSEGTFGLNKESHQFYDHLDKLFENYNFAVRSKYAGNKVKLEELTIDKRPYLDVFYNKYCYKSSNNFVRSMTLIFYPLSVVSRGVKFGWAMLMNKPSMKHQIVKNFCKDVVILSQFVTPLARLTADLNLYLSGVVRGVAFLTLLPLAGLIAYPLAETSAFVISKFKSKPYVRTPFSNWFAVLDYYICKYIAFHKTPALQPVRQMIVRAARVAGINSDLEGASKKIQSQLDVTAKTFADSNGSYNGLVASLGVTTDADISREFKTTSSSDWRNSSASIYCDSDDDDDDDNHSLGSVATL
ncbi:MAG: hypothetical protein P1U74_00450 [Legionellaceae bacterium]|nr:hypothetical protein [Legionellaceae bacterium]